LNRSTWRAANCRFFEKHLLDVQIDILLSISGIVHQNGQVPENDEDYPID
jgi:hypothetical protein